MTQFPPVPRYDPTKDGNPFRWIVATAPKARAKRQAVLDAETARRWRERAAHWQPVEP